MFILSNILAQNLTLRDIVDLVIWKRSDSCFRGSSSFPILRSLKFSDRPATRTRSNPIYWVSLTTSKVSNFTTNRTMSYCRFIRRKAKRLKWVERMMECGINNIEINNALYFIKDKCTYFAIKVVLSVAWAAGKGWSYQKHSALWMNRNLVTCGMRYIRRKEEWFRVRKGVNGW